MLLQIVPIGLMDFLGRWEHFRGNQHELFDFLNFSYVLAHRFLGAKALSLFLVKILWNYL